MLTPDQFIQHLQERSLCSKNDRILLAVSGGADSMVMLHLFHTAGYQVGVAHANFRLRGEASDQDQRFAEQIAEQYQVPFFTTGFDTLAFAQLHNMSIEEAARELRYAWLEDVRMRAGYQRIATAHHKHDAAETMLLHLVRGTGLQGVSGIPEMNGYVIRPMLFTDRTQITAYCAQWNIPFCTDQTNTDTKFRRNYIRHLIIPKLEELNPGFIQTMSNNARHFKESLILMRQQTDKILHKWISIRGEDQYLARRAIQKHPAARTILHTWLSPFGFNEEQCVQILMPHGSEAKTFSGKSHRLVVTRDHFVLTSVTPQFMATRYIDRDEKTIACGNYTLSVQIIAASPALERKHEKHIAIFDADRLQWPLLLRPWKAGDYCYPIGLRKMHSDKPGKKKVSDLLTDAKLSSIQKERTGVLLSGEHIIWVPGVRQDGRFAVTKKTQHILKIKMLLK